MAQFDLYANPHLVSRASVPYVLDVQSDLLDALPTRLVLPLSRIGATLARLPRNLCPQIVVEGEPLALMPHLAAPLDKRLLRQPIESLIHRAHEVCAALDAVTAGV